MEVQCRQGLLLMVQCRLKPQVIGKKDESSNYSTLEEPEEQAQCKLEPACTCEH